MLSVNATVFAMAKLFQRLTCRRPRQARVICGGPARRRAYPSTPCWSPPAPARSRGAARTNDLDAGEDWRTLAPARSARRQLMAAAFGFGRRDEDPVCGRPDLSRRSARAP